MRREKKAVREQRCVDEIISIIRAKYPNAEFVVTKKPGIIEGPWIETYVPDEASWDVIELVGQRGTDMLIDDDVFIHVIPQSYDRRPSLKAAAEHPPAKSA